MEGVRLAGQLGRSIIGAIPDYTRAGDVTCLPPGRKMRVQMREATESKTEPLRAQALSRSR
jgi:hypothetical protein